MKQDGVGEQPSKPAGGKVMASRFCCQTSRPDTSRAMATNSGQPSSPDDHVPEIAEGHEIAPGPAAEIEDAIRRGPGDRSE
jgi:hypothetical protein